MSWKTTNAATVSIDGIGDVPTVGVKTVTPTESTTYHLVAHGDGGSADASASVTVNSPPAISVPSTGMNEQQDFDAHVQPIFFDYDNYDIRGDAQAILAKNADYLNAHPNIKVVIGGYCDERGSDEYNLVLGQNRAQAAKTALVTAGIASRSHPRDQLRQGKAVLLRFDRGVLATEPQRRVHDRQVRQRDRRWFSGPVNCMIAHDHDGSFALRARLPYVVFRKF